VLPDGAGGEELISFDNNRADRREIERIDDLEAGQKLPGEEE
jgi:hypothetical protein